MVEDLAASYVALKLENEILQAQVKRLTEENAALQAQIPELQKSGAAKEHEPPRKPSEAQELPESPELLELPAARASQNPWEPPATTEPREPTKIREPREPSAISKLRGPPEIKEPREPSTIRKPRSPSEIKEPRELSAIRDFMGIPEIQEPQEPQEPQETNESGGPSAITEFRGSPEIKKSHSSPKFKECWGLQEFPKVKESWEPPESLDSTTAWGLQELSKYKKAHKPPELQDLAAWNPATVKEHQEIQKALESPATQKPQASPRGYDLPAVGEAEPTDNQGTPALKELQNSQLHNPTNDAEPQTVPEHQETSSQPEPLEHPATQETLEPQVLQEPLDPSDAKEFLELSVPEESLEGLIVVRTGTEQAHHEIEAPTLPLEYPLAFSEDFQKLSEFLVQLNSYLRTRGYPTEAALVSFVGSFFSGEAGRLFQPLLDSQTSLLEQFERLLRALQDTFDNPDSLEVANQGLPQLRQGEGLAPRYSTRFHLIAQELNLGESTLCIQFQEELASSIQNELSCISPVTNLSDVTIECVTLEEKASGGADSSSSSSEEENGSESPPTENQPVQATSNRPHLSEAERARRREGHLCLYCGHPGHFARDCPVKPQRAQQAGNMEARR